MNTQNDPNIRFTYESIDPTTSFNQQPVYHTQPLHVNSRVQPEVRSRSQLQNMNYHQPLTQVRRTQRQVIPYQQSYNYSHYEQMPIQQSFFKKIERVEDWKPRKEQIISQPIQTRETKIITVQKEDQMVQTVKNRNWQAQYNQSQLHSIPPPQAPNKPVKTCCNPCLIGILALLAIAGLVTGLILAFTHKQNVTTSENNGGYDYVEGQSDYYNTNSSEIVNETNSQESKSTPNQQQNAKFSNQKEGPINNEPANTTLSNEQENGQIISNTNTNPNSNVQDSSKQNQTNKTNSNSQMGNQIQTREPISYQIRPKNQTVVQNKNSTNSNQNQFQVRPQSNFTTNQSTHHQRQLIH